MATSATTRKAPTPRAIATFSLPVAELVAVDEAAALTGKHRSAFIREAAVKESRRVLAKKAA